MALTVLFMIFFAVVLVLWSYKNQYSFLFAIMGLSMAVAITTMVIEIQRTGNYYVSRQIIYSPLDARIFKYLNRLFMLSVTELQMIRNISIVVFLFMNLFFIRLFIKSIKKSASLSKIKYVILQCAMALFSVIYLIFYHPKTGYYIYLAQFGVGKYRLFLNTFTGAIHAVMVFGVFVYLVYPIAFLIYHYRKKTLTLFLEQMLSLIFALGALDSMFIFFFFSDSPALTLQNVRQTGFWRSIYVSQVPRYYTSVLPVISFAVLLVISFFLIRFQTTNLLEPFKEYSIKKNLRGMHDNLRDVLHSEKNVIFSAKILAQEVKAGYGTEEGMKKLDRLLELSETHLESLTQTINNIKDFRIKTINQDFFVAINQALQHAPLPPNITLKTDFCCEKVFCNYDVYHMTQVIVNLLVNATDAVKEIENPYIKLSISLSDSWIYFSVEDNGVGIESKKIRKIYKPYFSSKSKQNNWGIGLSYVSRVIKAHWGYIRVRSEEGKGTEVSIILMRGKER